MIKKKKKAPELSSARQKQVARRLLGYAKPFLPLLILSFVVALISTALSLYIPVLVGNAIDMIIDKDNVFFDIVSDILPAILVATLISAVCDMAVRLIGNTVSAKITRDIRLKCAEKISKIPISYIDSHRTGDTLNRIISDVDRLSDGLLTGITQFYSSVLAIFITLILMFKINWIIALVVALLTPLSMIIASFIANSTFSMYRDQSAIQAKQTALLDESVSGRTVISAFTHEDASISDFDILNAEYRSKATRAVFFSSITNPATRFVNSLVYCAVALIGALLAISKPDFMPAVLTAGALSCLLNYAHNYAKPFNELSGVVAELQASLASASRVFEYLDTEEDVPDRDAAEALAVSDIDGSVSAEKVSFSYSPEKPFMEDICFDAPPKGRVAIVGPTGCGKTTLINLFMRFYETTGGDIRISGREIKDITRESLRASFGMVLQDTWLSSGTVRENIAMGKPDATFEEIVQAAKAAHSHSFIKRLPKGYDTVLGEDGGRLSQGEKQLLCITRVMLALPPMLILDEATSSIDTRTEIKIQNAFAEMMQGRTSFIVAHRLNTIKNADLILVMKDGKIVERGTHDELMSSGGFYSSLYGAQFEQIN